MDKKQVEEVILANVPDIVDQVVEQLENDAKAHEDEDDESKAGNPEDEENEKAEAVKPEDEEEIKAAIIAMAKQFISRDTGVSKAEPEELEEAVVAVLEEVLPELVEEGAKAFFGRRQKRRDTFQKGVAAARKAAEKDAPARSRKAEAGGFRKGSSIKVGDNLRYAHMSAEDMAMGAMMRISPLKSQGIPYRMGDLLSEEYLRAMITKAHRFSDTNPYRPHINAHMKAALPIKADEIDMSTAAGFGDEWVGVFYSNVLWEKVRFNRIFQAMVSKGMMDVEIPQGAESTVIPTESSDPTVYTAPQAVDTDASGRPEVTANITPFGTGSKTLTPKELKLATSWTTILDEDAVIPIAAQVSRQVTEKMEETIEQILINGDTETAASTNINLVDGTPATGLSTPYYIASDGFLKVPLIDNTGNKRDDGGIAPDLDTYRLTLQKLDGEKRARRDRLAFIIDPDTEIASLAIPELATDDVRRTNATVTSGILENVYGIDVFTSGFMLLANSAGKVPSAGGTLGRVLCVYAPYWAFGFKRQITIETDRDIMSGSNLYVASMRMGVVERGTDAAALSYNILITS